MKALFTSLFFICSLYGWTQSSKRSFPVPKRDTDKIDALFAAFDKKDSPGYAIGIIKNNTILYAKGYGSANLDYEIPITTDSSFDIASVSKQFTAACIALLILENKLSLETPLAEFVSDVSKYKDTIRIKHLIYNTSGLTDYFKLSRSDGNTWITFNYFDIDYCIKTSLSQDTLAFTPGDKWDYCNVNYMLLTKVVEKVSGMPFSTFSKQKLFEPLGMHNTLINDDVTQVIKNRVTPYNKRTPEYVAAYKSLGITIKEGDGWLQHPRNSPHYGGSGVVTTVNDLMIWSGNFFSKKFGGQQFYDLMHRTESFKNGRNNQAFGLYLDKYKGRAFAAWDGGDYGISSQLIRFTDKNIAIIVLSNIGSGEAFNKANSIADMLIENGEL
jgi:CubicO group peptidase (beta-lactamase class C family)